MKETFVLVKHDVDTSNETSPDGDGWIHYWERKTQNVQPSICPCCGKKPSDKNPMVGAHVIRIIDFFLIPRKRYITPTCDECNKRHKGIKSNTVFPVLPEYLLESPY